MPGLDTLQQAYDQAPSGALLVLADGVFTSTRTLAGQTGHGGQGRHVLLIKKSITIRALNAGRAVIDGGGKIRGIYVKIDRGTVNAGTQATYGADISVTLEGLNITNCTTVGSGRDANDTFNSYGPTCPGNGDDGFGAGIFVDANRGIPGDFRCGNTFGALSERKCEVKYVTVTSCNIYRNVACGGGGISVDEDSDLTLSLTSCNIFENTATGWYGGGGGIRIRSENGYENAPGIHVILTSCSIYGNGAYYHGGGYFGEEGRMSVYGNTVFYGNILTSPATGFYTCPAGLCPLSSPAQGRNLFTIGATINVFFPLPPGHWVPNSECVVYREACPRATGIGNDIIKSCVASISACKLAPDPSTTVTATIPKSSCSGKHASECSDPQPCQPRTFIQPCDWMNNPGLLATYPAPPLKVYTAPFGIPIDDKFPYECAAGLLGSADAASQLSSMCQGSCPAGYYCPTPATTQAVVCPPGSYCLEGATTPMPCPGGTYSITPSLQSAAACTSASAGYFAEPGSTQQTACAKGTYTDASIATKDKCAPCPSGTYQDAAGQSACKVCGAGSYCPLSSATELPCFAGTYSDQTGLSHAGECSACPAGSVCAPGSTAPTACAPGTITSSAGQSECTSCPRDGETGSIRYQSEAGQTSCLTCGAGNYSATALSCEPCGVGDFCLAGAVVGTACSTQLDSSTTAGRGAASVDDCACKPGYFKQAGVCQDCTRLGSGVDCKNPIVSMAALPVKQNFWRISENSTSVLNCYTVGVCGARNAGAAATTANGTSSANEMPTTRRRLEGSAGYTYGDFLCRTGHSGPFCEVCAYNWYKQPDGYCADCTESEGSIGTTVTIAAIICGVLLTVAIWRLVCASKGGSLRDDATNAADARTMSSKARGAVARAAPGTKARILVSLVQVVTQLGLVFDIPFPPLYSNLMRYFGLIQLDFLTFLPTDCIFPGNNFYTSLVISTLVPLGIFAVLFLSAVACRACKSDDSMMANRLLDLIFDLLFLIYPSTATKIFSTFQCFDLDDGAGNIIMSRLRVDFSIDCDAPDRFMYFVYALVMLVVYVIGTLSLYAFLLFLRYGEVVRKLAALEAKRIVERKDEEARKRLLKAYRDDDIHKRLRQAGPPAGQQHASESSAEAAEKEAALLEKEEERLLQRLPSYVQKLLSGYAYRTFYFEIVDCVRKLLIVCMPVFFPAGSPGQLIFGLLICFLTSCAYAWLDPYKQLSTTRLALIAQLQIFFALLSSIALSFDPSDFGTSAMDYLLSFLVFVPFAVSGLLGAYQAMGMAQAARVLPQPKAAAGEWASSPVNAFTFAVPAAASHCRDDMQDLEESTVAVDEAMMDTSNASSDPAGVPGVMQSRVVWMEGEGSEEVHDVLADDMHKGDAAAAREI